MRLAIPNRDELGEPLRFALDYLVASIGQTFAVAHDDSGRQRRTILSVYANGAQSHTSSGNWQAVNFNSMRDVRGVPGVLAAPSSVHSQTVNPDRFVVPASLAGFVRVSTTVVFGANATGSRGVYLDRNGAQEQGAIVFVAAATAAGSTCLHLTWAGMVQAQDVLKVYAYQNSGGALNLGSATASAQNTCVIEFP